MAHASELTPEQACIAQLETELSETKDALVRLRRAYHHALEQLQLLRRRLSVAKAERVDASAAQLAFDAMFEKVQQLGKALDEAEGKDPSGDHDGKEKKRRPGGKGRRDLAESDLPVVRVEIADPQLDATAERIGFEHS